MYAAPELIGAAQNLKRLCDHRKKIAQAIKVQSGQAIHFNVVNLGAKGCTDGQPNTKLLWCWLREGSLTARNFKAAVEGNKAARKVTVKDDGDCEELWM